jgi:hypothetical protein
MFGLESQKKKKDKEPFLFDLEIVLKEGEKAREIKARIEDKIQKIKTVLKNGESKEEYDQFGILLHGYTSLQKVITRCPSK